MTIPADQVAGMDKMFVKNTVEQLISTDKHKEKCHKSRLLDKTARVKIQDDLDKYPHPLKESNPDNLFNMVFGQVGGTQWQCY